VEVLVFLVDVRGSATEAEILEAVKEMETAVAMTAGTTKGTTGPKAKAKGTSALLSQRTVHHPTEAALTSTTAGKTTSPTVVHPTSNSTADEHGTPSVCMLRVCS